MITIAVLISMMAYVIPLTYPQDSGETTTFGEYGDPMSPEYGWKGYLANGGERTAYNPGPAPDTTNNLLWTSTTSFADAMVALNGLVVFSTGSGMGGRSSTIYALDPNTGTTVWTRQLSASAVTMFGYAQLFVVDETHLLVLASGVTMIDATNGQILWTDSTISPFAVYHPALYSQETQMLYGPVGGTSSVLNRLNIDTELSYVECGWNMSEPDVNKGSGNRIVWGYPMNHGGFAQLCYGDGKVYMGEYSGWGVYALNATTGEFCWRCIRRDAAGYAATYGDGKLFVGCQSRVVSCINTTTGEKIWENEDGLATRGFNVWHGCYAYGRVYWHDLGAGLSGATKCIDADTGETLWASLTVSNIGYYQICVADGKVFGQMSDGSSTTGRDPPPTQFGCWDAFTGELLWTLLGVSCDSPTVAYGNLYLFVSSRVRCYGPSPAPDPPEPTPPPEPVNWAMWRGNTENPGVAVGQSGPVGLSSGPIWTYKTGAGISSSPAVADGKVFIGSFDGYLYCLDVEDGHQIWKFKIGQYVQSSPAYYDGKVYTGSDNGYFYCIDAETGQQIWNASDGDGTYRPFVTGSGQMIIRSSPIIYDNRVYVGGGTTGIFYCFNPDTGDTIWSYSTGGTIQSSAAIADGYVYIFSGATNLYKFSLASGALEDRFSIANSGYSSGIFARGYPHAYTPVVVGDRIYIGLPQGYLVCIDANTGSEIYRAAAEYATETTENPHGSLLYYNGVIYAPAGPTVEAANADNGQLIWTAWGSWMIFCSTVLATDTATGGAVVYCGSEAGSMTCWDATTGEAISWYTTDGPTQSTPAIYDGKLIFGSADNKVYCFEDPVYDELYTMIDVSLSKDTVYIDSNDNVTITAELWPAIPGMDLVATLIKPDGVSVVDLDPVVSDIKGKASFTYTPDEVGNWSVMTSWAGIGNLRGVAYPAAYSGLVNLTALVTPATLVASVSPAAVSVNPSEPATLTASATGGTPDYMYQWYSTYGGIGTPIPGYTSNTLTVTLTDPNVYGYYCEVTDSAGEVDSSDTAEVTVVGGGGMSMELVFIVVGVIAVAVIAVVAYMYLKKRK